MAKFVPYSGGMMEKHRGSWSILCIEDNYDTYLFTKALVSQVKDRQINIEWSSNIVEGLAKLFYANKEPGGGYNILLINYQFIQQNGSETLQTIVNEYQVTVILFNSQETEIDFNDLRLYQWPIIHQSRLSPALIEGVITNAIELRHKDIILQQYKEQVERDAIELKRNAAELEAVFNAQTDAVVLSDLNGTPVRVNPAAEKVLGFNPMGMKAEEIAQRLHYTDLSKESVTHRALRGERIVDEEHILNGRTYLASSIPVSNREGQISGVVTVLKDITERKQVEDAVALSRKKLQIALNAARMGTWEYKPMEDRIKFGANAQKLYCSPGGWISHTDMCQERMHPDDIPQMEQAVKAASDPSGSGEYEVIYRIRQDDGSWLWLHAWGQMEFQGEGAERHPVRMIGSSQDITQHKETEAFLAYGVSLLDNIHDAIIATNLETRITGWNKAAEELYGYSSEEVLGKPVNEILKSELSDEQHIRALQELSETGRTTQEVVQSTKDGRRVYVEGKAITWKDSYGNIVGYVTSVRDVTKRKQAEEALRESEARFRTMADGTPVMIWVHNASGAIEFVSRAWMEYFAVTLDEVRAGRWQVLVHPDYDESYSKEFVKCSQERKPFRAVARVRRGDGAWRWVDSQAQPRFSEDGTFLGMVGSSLDITERIEAENELKKYTQELERSNQALQDFTTLASHDLQEPLRKIRSFGELLQDRYSDQLDEEGSGYLNRMVDGARRMGGMLDDLLLYSRVTTHAEPFEAVNLQEIAAGVISDLEVQIEETDALVELGLLPTIQADPLQMRQLLKNLIGNALKFHRKGVRPSVSITCQPSGAHSCCLIVQDNGIGFDDKDARRIFTPFVRLHGKSEYPGYGIGLAICQKIVERHSGQISAESVPGEGSRFIVELPAVQAF